MNLKNFKNFILTFTLFSITILVFALPVLAEGKVQRQYLSNKDNLSEPQKKISTDLLQLINNDFVMEDARQFLSADSIFPVTNEIIVDDLVYVYIYLKPGEGTQVISSYDLEVTDRDEENHFASAWVKVKDLETIASLDAVRAVRTVLPPVINMGSVVTEGDGIHRTSNVRSIYSQSGSGMKIGVISNGVRNISSAQASDDLPAGVTVLSDTVGGDEGTAMLEIIYDMVPETDLYFHDCGNNTIAFNSAIDSLVAAGCQVIVDDVGWITEPFFEDGIIASHIASILDDDNKDIIYISSAGNAGQEHYQGTYYEYEDVDSNKWYDFSKEASATTKSLYVDIPNNGRVRIVLQWDDEFGKSENDYDLYLSAVTIGDLGSGENTQDADGNYDPLEYIDYTNSSGVSIDAQIDVLNLQALGNETLEVFIYTSGGAIVSTDNISAADSIFGHPAVPGVIATGAIDAGDSGNDNIESFSSQGPVTIKYPLVESREKPDLCGIDGVTVTGAGGFPSPFSGTSAAAPHIAAIAAQIWGQFSDKTGDEIRNILITSAIDLGDTVGFDTVYGYGRADALNALEENLTPTTTLSGTPPEFTNLTTADITLGGTGVTHYEYKLDNGAYSEESLVATHINLSGLSEGSHTICVIGKNSADTWQAEENPTCYSWTIDTIKPTVSVTASSGPVEAGQVTITLNFLEQGVGLDTGISPVVTITGLNTVYTVEKTSFADTTWTGTFTLLDENEEKTAIISVAGATDLAGNVMDTDNSAGTFEVDTKEPVLPTITSPSSATATNADAYAICGTAEADSLVKVYKGETLVGSQQLTEGTTDFSIEVNLEQNADNIFKVTATDSVGNEGQAVTVSTITEDSIFLTTTLISVDGDTTSSYYTNDKTPEIILSGEANMVCRWSTNNTVYSTMDSDNECTINGSQAVCTLSDQGADSQKTVYTSCKDIADNEQSEAQNLNVTFTLDTAKPTVLSATASPDPAKAGTVTITVNFTKQGVGLDTEISPTVTITGLDTTYTATKFSYSGTIWTGTFTLKDEDEEKTATITVAGSKDLAGNVMDENLNAGTFEVDTKEPTAISVSINSGAAYINTTSITLTISALGASQMKITGDITDSFDWTAYATSTVATLTSGDGEKNIIVFFKDEVSNETQVSDSIILDQTNPQISSATASSDTVKAATVTIILNFLEEQGLDTEVSPFVTILGLNTTSTVEQISYSGTTWQGTFTLLDENEEKTATVSVAGAKDLVGNVMEENNSAGTFEVDTITPSIDSVSPAVDATEKEVTTDITVIFSEEIDSNTLEFSLDSVSGTTNYADKTFTFTPEESLSYDKEYTAKILVKDIVGNLMDEFIWSFKTKKRSYSGGGGGSSGGASTTAPLLPEGEEEEEEEIILEVTPIKEIISISQGGGANIVLPEKTEVSVEIPPEAVPLPEAETPEILAEIETTISPVVKTIPIVSEPVSSIPEKKEIVGNYIYDFSSTVGGTAVEVFEKPVTLTFTYTDEQIEGLDEETLTVNYWDEDFLEWIALPTVVDRENNIVTATTTHFTYYIVMADIIIEEPIIPEEPVVEKEEPFKKEPVKKLTIEEIKLKIIEILTKLIELFIQLSRFVEIKE